MHRLGLQGLIKITNLIFSCVVCSSDTKDYLSIRLGLERVSSTSQPCLALPYLAPFQAQIIGSLINISPCLLSYYNQHFFYSPGSLWPVVSVVKSLSPLEILNNLYICKMFLPIHRKVSFYFAISRAFVVLICVASLQLPEFKSIQWKNSSFHWTVIKPILV